MVHCGHCIGVCVVLPHSIVTSVPLCIPFVTQGSKTGCVAVRYIVDTVLLCVLFYHTVLSHQYHYPFRLSHRTVRQGVWLYGTLWTLYWCVCCFTTQYCHVTSVPLYIPFVTQDSKTGCVAVWYIVDTVLVCVLFYHTVLSRQYHYAFRLSHRTVRQGVWLYGALWTLYCCGFVLPHSIVRSVPLCIPFVTQDSKTGCVAVWYIVDTVLVCVLYYHTVLSHHVSTTMHSVCHTGQ